MKSQFKSNLVVLICASLLVQPILCTSLFGDARSAKGFGKKGFKGIAKGIAKGARALAVPKVLAAKKAFFLAPMAVPIAIGTKVALGAKLAIPMGIGAAIGAPIGAFIGAKVGAIKGAIVAKTLLAAKVAAAKKLAIGTAAVIAKPFVLAAGVKAKLAGAGLGLVGKGVAVAGTKVAEAGKKITVFSEKIKGLTAAVAARLTPSIPAIPAFPALPVLPTLLIKTQQEPTLLHASFTANGPFTGYKFGRASVVTRRRREAEAEPEADPQTMAQRRRNVQEMLQFVNAHNAQNCLARVICELSASPNVFGNEGMRFGRSLIALESQADRASAQHYRHAANTGLQMRNHQVCINVFPNCAFQSPEIIRIGNDIING